MPGKAPHLQPRTPSATDEELQCLRSELGARRGWVSGCPLILGELSKHIRESVIQFFITKLTPLDDRLGIKIKPSEVRHNPRANDP